MLKQLKNRVIITVLFTLFIINTTYAKTTYIEINNIKSEVYYYFNNNTNLSIKLKFVHDELNLIFLQNFHQLWFLKLEEYNTNEFCYNDSNYKDKNSGVECFYKKNLNFKDILLINNKPLFEDTHQLVYDYANQWTIDPEYIKANYDPKYYKENPDGSIDIELTLYFKPQSYFYLGIIISGTTLILCLVYLGYDFWKNRKKKLEQDKSNLVIQEPKKLENKPLKKNKKVKKV